MLFRSKVTLAINPALVGTYNALHGTDYSLLTSASLKQSTIMIKQGKTTPEESVALSFSDDMASVQLGTNYVIPVTITNVDGVGADIGENKVIYIVYKTALVGFLSCVDKPVGSVINDHSGIGVGFSFFGKRLERTYNDGESGCECSGEGGCPSFVGEDRPFGKPGDRKSTRLNSSHRLESRMPSSA